MAKLNYTNLRVNVDKSTHHIYVELTGRAQDKAEDMPFIKMPDLFVIAACVGAKEDKYKSLVDKKDIFVADALDATLQIPVLEALAFKREKNLDILENPREILQICERWANGGIHMVYNQVLLGEGLRPLYRLVDFILEESES